MEYFVGYFEMVNMQYAGANVGLAQSLGNAFIKPIGYVAIRNPEIRFEAFEDSLVMGVEADDVDQFLEVLRSLYAAWSMSYLLVRGGVAFGEVDSVEGAFRKELLNQYQQIDMYRISGRPVIQAFRLVELDTPGMVCFLTPLTREIIEYQYPERIYGTNPSSYIWLEPARVEQFTELFTDMLGRPESHLQKSRPHIEATLEFLEYYGR